MGRVRTAKRADMYLANAPPGMYIEAVVCARSRGERDESAKNERLGGSNLLRFLFFRKVPCQVVGS